MKNMPKKRKVKARTRIKYAYKKTRARAKGYISKLGMGNIKTFAIGIAGYDIVRRMNPFTIGPVQKPAMDKIITGIALSAAKMDNKDFLTVGIKEAITDMIDGFLGGTQGATGVGGL